MSIQLNESSKTVVVATAMIAVLAVLLPVLQTVGSVLGFLLTKVVAPIL